MADITLEIADKIDYGELVIAFDQALKSDLPPDKEVSWEPIDIYSSDKLAGKKRYTFRVLISSHSHTLTDNIMSEMLERAMNSLAQKIHSQRI